MLLTLLAVLLRLIKWKAPCLIPGCYIHAYVKVRAPDDESVATGLVNRNCCGREYDIESNVPAPDDCALASVVICSPV